MRAEHTPYFLDSNIILYRFDKSAPEKRQIAHELIGKALVQENGFISPQVVQECLNVLTSKARELMTFADAHLFLNHILLPLVKPMDIASLYAQALTAKEKYKFSFYDALIVASALQMGCNTLFSEDMQHGQRIDGMKIVNPFVK